MMLRLMTLSLGVLALEGGAFANSLVYDHDSKGRVCRIREAAKTTDFTYDAANNLIETNTHTGTPQATSTCPLSSAAPGGGGAQNSPPIALSRNWTWYRNDTLDFPVTYIASDPDGDPLTIISTTEGTIIRNGTEIRVDVGRRYGRINMTFMVQDPSGATDQGTFEGPIVKDD